MSVVEGAFRSPDRTIVLTPGELHPGDLDQWGLVDLMKGYDAGGDLRTRAAQEFSIGDTPTHIYLDFRGDKAAGALVVRYWDEFDGNRGQRFYRTLTDSAPEIAQAAHDSNASAVLISGIIVDPQLRRQGIASSLLRTAFSTEQPPFILGSTKTVGQVITRTRVLDPLGYVTFYGAHLIEPDLNAHPTTLHRPVFDAFLNGIQKGDPITSTIVSPAIPDTIGLPEGFAEAFAPVVARQREIGLRTAVMQPLISIRRDLIPATQVA